VPGSQDGGPRRPIRTRGVTLNLDELNHESNRRFGREV
jgi:hypothetical protein